tara:strand:- start:407 stop:865 length:459 start_codon:yes stop_codon:yes gene_type:complete
MKKLLLLSALLLSFLSNSQPQTMNGIDFNAPPGYVKVDNFMWEKENNVFFVSAVDEISPSALKSIVENDTRYTKHFATYDLKRNGKIHKIGVHNSDNGLVQATLAVNKGGWCYIIITAIEPKLLNASNEIKVKSVIEDIFFNISWGISLINP